MDVGDKADPQRPSIQSAFRSPAIFLNFLASLILLVGFFVPHSLGGGSQNRPVTHVTESLSDENAVLILMMLWPYCFAGSTIVVICTLVMLRPSWFDKALLGLPIFCGTALTFVGVVLLFSRVEESRRAMGMAAIVAPLAACVIARMVWLCRAGEVSGAAAWGQSFLCLLAVFSLRWFWFPPVTRLLWGGILSITASILMMLASWTWQTRARHDLVDRSISPVPFQVSLQQIIGGITLTAIALAYWRIVATWH